MTYDVSFFEPGEPAYPPVLAQLSYTADLDALGPFAAIREAAYRLRLQENGQLPEHLVDTIHDVELLQIDPVNTAETRWWGFAKSYFTDALGTRVHEQLLYFRVGIHEPMTYTCSWSVPSIDGDGEWTIQIEVPGSTDTAAGFELALILGADLLAEHGTYSLIFANMPLEKLPLAIAPRTPVSALAD